MEVWYNERCPSVIRDFFDTLGEDFIFREVDFLDSLPTGKSPEYFVVPVNHCCGMRFWRKLAGSIGVFQNTNFVLVDVYTNNFDNYVPNDISDYSNVSFASGECNVEKELESIVASANNQV